MGSNRLICYYSDLYRSLKKEMSLRILVIDSKGYIVYRKNKIIKDLHPLSLAKYGALAELFLSLSELEKSLYIKGEGKEHIDIISFDKKVLPAFININIHNDDPGIDNIQKLRETLNMHSNWIIRYEGKSRQIFKNIYSQSIFKKGEVKIKGYKIPRKRQMARKVQDAIGTKCDNLAFFDVEMNCIDKKDNTLGYWEIVSIGVVKYNIKTKSISKFYSVIRPKIQRVLSDRCIQITGLNQSEIDNGIDFNVSMGLLQKWIGNGKTVFMSWGREDIKALKSNSRLEGNENQLINQIRNNYVDFQKEFSYYHEKMNQVVSLTKALEVCGLSFEGEQHNALNDAYNLYRVYKKYVIK